MNSPRRSPKPLCILATLTAAVMGLLILVGASVTSLDAGMAYTTAPLSNGALINPSDWLQENAKFVEHSHRLLGWTVGMLAIATVLSSFLFESRRVIRLLAIGVLGSVVAQGIMGIYRVNHDSAILAMLHGIWGQVTFGLTVLLAVMTAASWFGDGTFSLPPEIQLRKDASYAVPFMLVQLVLGALTRHLGGMLWLILHITWGIITAMWLSKVGFTVIGYVLNLKALRRWATALGGLLVLQLCLGLATFVLTGGSSSRVLSPSTAQWIVPTSHALTGALLLGSSIAIMALTRRFVRPAAQTESQIDSSLIEATSS